MSRVDGHCDDEIRLITRPITGIIEQIDGLACRLEEKVRHHMGSVAHTRGGAASGTEDGAFF